MDAGETCTIFLQGMAVFDVSDRFIVFACVVLWPLAFLAYAVLGRFIDACKEIALSRVDFDDGDDDDVTSESEPPDDGEKHSQPANGRFNL